MEGEGDLPVIKPFGKAVVHRICSGQVIFDLSSAVKELVENSLDAGATSIEVSLKVYGEESFKVVDNGCGISPSNFQVLALKHHTSKISDFSDLNSLMTFGFRGEALSSLCALGKLTVETRTKNEPVGTHLEFDRSGVVITDRKTARQVGTTVTIEKLFSTLPVRSKEFSRNIRREYGKLVSLLNAYALIAKGVRLLCTNTIGRNSKSLVLKTQGSSSLKDNIITIFGLNTFQCLEPLSINISEGCKVEGFLSKSGYGCGRNLGDRQFFYVNGRPVDMPKVSKLINELYKTSNSKQYPIAILDFCIPTTSYDVNVTPDKRKIFFSSERSMMLSLRAAIEKIYSPQQCSYSINCIKDPSKEEDTDMDGSNEDEDLIASAKISSPENDTHKETADSDDQVSPKTQQVLSSEVGVTIGVISTDDNFLPRDPTSEVDKSAGLSAFCYKQPKSFANSTVKFDRDGAACARTGWTAKPSDSNIVQSSLMKFVSVNKRKHEDSGSLLSEVPVLRHGACSGQMRKISSETYSSGTPSSCKSIVPEVDSPQRIDLLQQHSPESFVSTKACLLQQHSSPSVVHEDSCNHLSEVPVLRNGSCSGQMRKTSSESLASSTTISCTSNVPEVDLPERIDLLQQHSPPSFVSARVGLLQQHCPPPPVVFESTEVPHSGECDVHCRGSSKDELNGPALSDSDACKKDPEVESGNILSTSPLPDAHDNDNGATGLLPDAHDNDNGAPKPCSTSVSYPVMQFTVNELRRRRQQRVSISCANKFSYQEKSTRRCYMAATLCNSQREGGEGKLNSLAAATYELDRLFKKEDFREMQVVGQFNLGFIIGKLDQDLFIVDQHAADEKYNFESLSQSTILNLQPLLQPIRLELSPEEEVVASMHMDTIRKNGFVLAQDVHAPPGHHFLLKAVPFSKNITFGVQDVKELISTLSDSQGDCSMISSYKLDTADSICPSRVRAMLASRACRTSVMIGDPLTKVEMQKILKNLAGLRSPWNCPHGRPTMRHLADLTTIKKEGATEKYITCIR